MVYAGIGPLTGREIRFRKTCKTEQAAQIELGRLLAQAAAGRQPDSAITVAQLPDQYLLTAGWDVSTRESNLRFEARRALPVLPPGADGEAVVTEVAKLAVCGRVGAEVIQVTVPDSCRRDQSRRPRVGRRPHLPAAERGTVLPWRTWIPKSRSSPPRNERHRSW